MGTIHNPFLVVFVIDFTVKITQNLFKKGRCDEFPLVLTAEISLE